MPSCDYADFSVREDSLIKLCEYPEVSLSDMDEIKEIVSYLPLPLSQVKEGDELTISIIDNRIEGVKGFLSIWHNRGIACINTGADTVWGKWNEDERVLLTGESEIADENASSAIIGEIAYNSHGIRGIYSQGIFFRLVDRLTEMNSNHGAAHADMLERFL